MSRPMPAMVLHPSADRTAAIRSRANRAFFVIFDDLLDYLMRPAAKPIPKLLVQKSCQSLVTSAHSLLLYSAGWGEIVEQIILDMPTSSC